MLTPKGLIDRADEYARQRGLTRVAPLGQGKDGAVWRTSRPSALKLHERDASYRAERNAYMRFRDVNLTDVNGFSVPKLIDHADDLLAMELSIVFPPFVVDFASVVLDVDPELIEDEGHTLADLVRERFGDERVAVVVDIRDELIARAGAYLSDLHAHNIKFET